MEYEEYALPSQRRIIVAEGLFLNGMTGDGGVPEDLKAALIREGGGFLI